MAETLYEKDYVAWLQDQQRNCESPDRNTLDWQSFSRGIRGNGG
ncbi:MAG UNVERIFIED_CONTAM: DUF29 domain-containing protein [Microcystis novacekii LVE1205-3]|jgi:hypothetical protein